jgi:hypothetical protein
MEQTKAEILAHGLGELFSKRMDPLLAAAAIIKPSNCQISPDDFIGMLIETLYSPESPTLPQLLAHWAKTNLLNFTDQKLATTIVEQNKEQFNVENTRAKMVKEIKVMAADLGLDAEILELVVDVRKHESLSGYVATTENPKYSHIRGMGQTPGSARRSFTRNLESELYVKGALSTTH